MRKKDPDILFELASQMALRLRKTSQKVGNLAFMDVTGRVARTLIDLTGTIQLKVATAMSRVGRRLSPARHQAAMM